MKNQRRVKKKNESKLKGSKRSRTNITFKRKRQPDDNLIMSVFYSVSHDPRDGCVSKAGIETTWNVTDKQDCNN